MNISQVGINLIKSYEGCVLTSYQDVAGVWTIGYGHTSGVTQGQSITQQQADTLLVQDLQTFSDAVNSLVKVVLNQYQFDALVSFTYNVGKQALATSTLLEMLNNGDYAGASNQFPLWIHAGGKVVQGLVNRRKAEQTLFNREFFTPSEPTTFQVVRVLQPTDIRSEASHTSGYIRNGQVGEEFNVIAHQGDWHNVILASNEYGWIDGNGGKNLYWVNNPALQVNNTTQDYTIRTGENLTIIARRMGTTVNVIMGLNPSIKNANMVYAGQKIKVPSK
jgi:lysozyme